jgi:multicomponent Na+:H+ antiporter subunit D
MTGMSSLIPLVVALPILVACVATAAQHFLERSWAADAVGVAGGALLAVLTSVLLVRTWAQGDVYWFGGWRPRGELALGISFAVDPLGAALAALCGILVLAALLFSWRYFDETGVIYHVLMLLFGVGMVGMALTGDLFNLFVFFELMSVSAFTLAAYKVEEKGPLQGAFNFAITNTLGAFLALLGIALVYGRTGALNMAQVGRSLPSAPDRLAVAAFVLITVGFLVKAAIVPFHFWLTDAHAAAPAPVCVLFSGVMVSVGLFAVARVYWTVFSDTLGAHDDAVRDVLLALGALTAIVASVMCVLQRHLKRLLAYSTIAHTGVFLIGFALLVHEGLAGTTMYVLAHAFAKGSLFMVAGIVLLRLEDVDELRLHGRGRDLPVARAVWFLAALALAGPPFVGSFLGHALTEDGAKVLGLAWVPWLLAFTTIATTGAVLRAGARVFLGWGERDDPLLSDQPKESPIDRKRETYVVMNGVAVVMVTVALAVGAWPDLAERASAAAERFQDRKEYAEHVLDNRTPHALPLPEFHTTTASVVWALVSTLGSLAFAAFLLQRGRLPAGVRAGAWRVLAPPLGALRAAHSGHIGDYVAWLTLGAGTLGVVWALTLT